MLKYTFKFKLDCVRKYKNSEYIDTTGLSCSRHQFMRQVRLWAAAYDDQGPGALRNGKPKKRWTALEKLSLVLEVVGGRPLSAVAREAHVDKKQLRCWVRKFREEGESGLELGIGRRPRRPDMTESKPKKGGSLPPAAEENESLRKRNEYLEKRNEYLEMENEYLKKLDALVSKREAAEAKAKKRKR